MLPITGKSFLRALLPVIPFASILLPAALPAEPFPRVLLFPPWSEEFPSGESERLKTDGGIYQYGNPTAAEQAHLESINRARLDPQAEADRLLGGNINEGLSSGAISLTPKQPLTFNAQLYQAARLHSQDMIDQDYFDHNSLDGRSPWNRIAAAGYTATAGQAENVALAAASYPLDAATTLLAMHDNYIIDAGVAGRGHRVNILNDTLREIGIGSASGSWQAYSYAWILTCDFGARQNVNSFILGVAFDDVNQDGRYTAGEGVGGVGIVARRLSDSQPTATATASAGGYGLPLPAGQYEVTATLLDGRKQTKSVSLANKNVKIDFKLAEFGLSPGGTPSRPLSALPALLYPLLQ